MSLLPRSSGATPPPRHQRKVRRALFVALCGAHLVACGSEGDPVDPGQHSTGGAAGHGGAGAAAGHGGAGGAGGGSPYTPISAIKETDHQGIPVLLGQSVTIRGVVTVPTDVFSVENHEIYVQDATGGVSVYEVNQQSVVVALGDDLEVSGTVAQYAGKTEIAQPVLVLHGSGLPLPSPTPVTTGELCAAGEPYDGDLATFTGVTIVGGEPWPVENQEGNFNLVVDDGSGACALRIDHQTELNGSPEPAQPMDVVGVVKQFDEIPPYDSGYALQARTLSDVTTTN